MQIFKKLFYLMSKCLSWLTQGRDKSKDVAFPQKPNSPHITQRQEIMGCRKPKGFIWHQSSPSYKVANYQKRTLKQLWNQLKISLTLSSPYANNPMLPCLGYTSQSAWDQPIFPLFSYPYELPWWLRDKESTVKSPATQEIPSIPGSGRSPGEWNGYPLQYSDLESPMDREPGRLQSMGWQRVRHDWATKHTHTRVRKQINTSDRRTLSSRRQKLLSF